MTSENLDYLKRLCSSPEYGISEKNVTKFYELLSSMLLELPFRDVIGKPTKIREEFKSKKEYEKLFASTMLNEDLPIFSLFESLDLLIGSNPGKFERLKTLKEVDEKTRPYLLTARRIMQRYISDTKPAPEPSSQKKVEETSTKVEKPNVEKSGIDNYIEYMVEQRKKAEQKEKNRQIPKS
jgi:hypothetical protein